MSFRSDRIEKRGSSYVVLSEAGKVLGKHPTRAEAVAQLGAVEASKARAKKDVDNSGTWEGNEAASVELPESEWAHRKGEAPAPAAAEIAHLQTASDPHAHAGSPGSPKGSVVKAPNDESDYPDEEEEEEKDDEYGDDDHATGEAQGELNALSVHDPERMEHDASPALHRSRAHVGK